MASYYQLDFEKPITALDHQIEQAQQRLAIEAAPPNSASTPGIALLQQEISGVEAKRTALIQKTYAALSPWETVRVAAAHRPQTREYIQFICRDFAELHGDRRYGDDPAIVTGFARIGPSPGMKVLIVGHQKGKTTSEKISCHFSCAPGGLPQGPAQNATCRQVPRPDRDARGHTRCLPRPWRRATRPGRGHRREHAGDGACTTDVASL